MSITIDTGGNPIIYYDMCAHCNLDTGGQHQINCPLYPGPVQSISIKQPLEGWNGTGNDNVFHSTYPEFVKDMKALIDNHPEWGIKYI